MASFSTTNENEHCYDARDGKPPPIATRRTSRPSSMNKKHLRARQQRLLMLCHSANCLQVSKTGSNSSGCSLGYCAKMTKLWAHISVCDDSSCSTKHCFSSRSIMTHYLKCRDENCATCLPVRSVVSSSRQNDCGVFSIDAPVNDKDSERRTSLYIPKNVELPKDTETDGKKKSSDTAKNIPMVTKI